MYVFKEKVRKIFEFLHCAHLPYFCTKSGQTTERISIQHNVEKNSLTWNSWFHEIFVKNCESKIPYIISTLTQFFFSSLSWSSVAFFHKRYKIPFDNCTNSTFFSSYLSIFFSWVTGQGCKIEILSYLLQHKYSFTCLSFLS